jgi:cytochrome c biogenesis protein CcmG/thiol:disulfide interchange protein DsbE
VVAAVVLLAFGYVRLTETKGYALRKGSEAPAFRLAALAGGQGELAALRGKLVVLNFWATWCPPCVAEMPSLERLHRTLGPEGVAVVTVATDEGDEDVRQFVSGRGLTMPVLRDPGGHLASEAYHTTGYPETFVLDRKGVLLEHVVGPVEWDSPEWVARLRGLLGPGPAPSAGAARSAAP